MAGTRGAVGAWGAFVAGTVVTGTDVAGSRGALVAGTFVTEPFVLVAADRLVAVTPGAVLVAGIAVLGGNAVEVGGKKTGARVGTSVGRCVGMLVGKAVGAGNTIVLVATNTTVAGISVGLFATIAAVLWAVAVRSAISGIAVSDWKPVNR